MLGQPFGINTNVLGLIATNRLNSTLGAQAPVLRSLAIGLSVSRGVDGPAALISSESLIASLRVLEAETVKITRTNAVISVAGAGLGEISDLLAEAQTLAVASANTGGLTADERAANQVELDSILQSVDRISATTMFNGTPLLDGSFTVTIAGGDSVPVESARSGELGQTTVDGESYSLADTSSGGAIDLVSGDVSVAQQVIKAAQDHVSQQRGELGAAARFALEPRLRSLSVAIENTMAAVSIIRDTDFASATAELTRLSVLGDAGFRMALIAQSNPSRALGLLTPISFRF